MVLEMFGQAESHPAGVRGLKPLPNGKEVEWPIVAPRRGAWVETYKLSVYSLIAVSHPAGVRGLKPLVVRIVVLYSSRTPQGCVG